MKCIKFLLICILVSFQSVGQINHFIYIQTEKQQPFYVKIKERVYSSSASGYVIIPKLTDGSYSLVIGFPKNEWPAQTMEVVVDNKDAGYVLKNTGAQSWSLFNLQSMQLVAAAKSNEAPKIPEQQKIIPQETEAVPMAGNKEEVKEQPQVKALPQTAKDTAVKSSVVYVAEKKAAAVPTISKIYASTEETGRLLVYTSGERGQVDTVTVFVPYINQQSVQTSNHATQAKPVAVTEKRSVEKEAVQEHPNAAAIIVQKEAGKPSAVITTNMRCNAVAGETAFLQLRKKMAAEDTDEAMISVATRQFSALCFTTEQIKNLAVLFLKDEGKYHFLDASYPYVSDVQHFSNLRSLLSDAYYIRRFDAMLR